MENTQIFIFEPISVVSQLFGLIAEGASNNTKGNSSTLFVGIENKGEFPSRP